MKIIPNTRLDGQLYGALGKGFDGQLVQVQRTFEEGKTTYTVNGNDLKNFYDFCQSQGYQPSPLVHGSFLA